MLIKSVNTVTTLLKYFRNVNNIIFKDFSTLEIVKPVKLSFTTYENNNGNKEAPLVIMHGLFGSKQNWTSLCKAYSQKLDPSRKVIALDLRNHGESAHSDEHSYTHLVEDLKQFLLENDLKKIALMGHSMGGRCAMLFALTYPEILERLIVVDISPFSLSPHLSEMPKILQSMNSVQMPMNVPLSRARSIVENQLIETISDKDVRAFILTNLIETQEKSYKWRVNIPTLLKRFNEVGKFPLVHTQFTGDTLFIGGEKSDFIPFHLGSKPKRLVYAVDFRNHGDSAHAKDNTYDDLVMDILKFIKTMELKKVSLLGHEVGGRTAMLISLKYPEIVDKLIVCDISPITTSHSFKVFPEIIRILNNLMLPPNVPLSQARAHIINCLSRIVKNHGLMSLVLMNLVAKSDGSYSWRFNHRALLEHFQELSSFPDTHNVIFDGPVLFLGGAKSDYIQKSDYPNILKLFPNAELKYIQGAGHWVHAEKPNEFLKLSMDFLNKKTTSVS